MAIESMYMKTGKGHSGIICITTNERSASIWANSHHLCNELVCDLLELGNAQTPISNKHNEENKGRIGSDDQDRRKTHIALRKCIHPLG